MLPGVLLLKLTGDPAHQVNSALTFKSCRLVEEAIHAPVRIGSVYKIYAIGFHFAASYHAFILVILINALSR